MHRVDDQQAPAGGKPHIGMLDGWRAFSIIAVVAGHWLPIGPHRFGLNDMMGASGMAMFFALSGFLITQLLLRDQRPAPFLIRRLCRIVPLGWAAVLVLALWRRPDGTTILANLFYVANLPPTWLMHGGQHLWSLCVEVQFYVGVALLVALAGRRGLYALPLLAIGVTAARVAAGQPISIVTWHRVDEILSGATLALIVARYPVARFKAVVPAGATMALLALLFASAHPASGPLAYLRPYFSAAAIGASLYAAPRLMQAVWLSAPARYIAGISYAIYVIHGVLTATWLGGENASTLERYARRPLLIAATWLLAHVSTRTWERWWIEWGRRRADRHFGAAPVPKVAA